MLAKFSSYAQEKTVVFLFVAAQAVQKEDGSLPFPWFSLQPIAEKFVLVKTIPRLRRYFYPFAQ